MGHTRAQIVATIGPASAKPETLDAMIAAGLDVARLNFSHGTHESNGAYIAALREAAARAGVSIPVILDLAGPRETTAGGHQFDTDQSILTEKDRADIEFGLSIQVDYFAQSYVGSADDVGALRSELDRRGAKTPIIAKIERREAIERYDDILSAANAIMVARGDLGQSIPLEDVPFAQIDLITKARLAKKPVIVATQMMLSMVDRPTPSRAEVTDVTYAIISGADAVMLSEETALGTYPAEAVSYMARIAARTERELKDREHHRL